MIEKFEPRSPDHARPARPGGGGSARRSRGLRAFARSRRSSVALQLAIIAVPFFMLVMGALEASYDMYLQAAVSLIAWDSGRFIWTGQLQGQTTSANFLTSKLCPDLGFLLICDSSHLIVRAQPVRPVGTADFYTFMHGTLPNYQTGSGSSGTLNVGGWSVCPGNAGDGVLVEVVYAGPTFVGGFIPNFYVMYSGNRVHPTYAASAFYNQVGYAQTVTC